MTVHHLHADEPRDDPLDQILGTTAADLTPAEFFDLVAHRFGIRHTGGDVTLELVYVNGTFRRAHLHRELKRADFETGGPR
jgi:hypothetical protein